MSDWRMTPSQGEMSAVVSGNLICFAAMALFALSFPLAEVLLGVWGPVTLIAVRNMFGLGVIFLAWRVVEWDLPMRGLPWARGALIGGIGFGIGSMLLLIAQSLTDAVTVALVAAAMPLAAVGLEVLLDGRRLTRWFVLGLGLVLVGGAMATGQGITQAQFGPGLILAALSVLFYSWGSRATVKNLPGYSPMTQTMLTSTGMAATGAIAWAALWIAGIEQQISPLSTPHIWAFIGYAVLGFAISQVMWVSAVGRIGVALASFHINAVPFYVMMILVTFGGSWNMQQVIGAGVVIAGVIISQRRRRVSQF